MNFSRKQINLTNSSGFTETFASLNPSKPWAIKLSSAGLVYVHYGRAIIEEVLKKLAAKSGAGLAVDPKLVDILEDKMYEQFVREIDAIDNGVEIADTRRYVWCGHTY